MAGETMMLPAARELAPQWQGDFSTLCGLYAIINAARLTLFPTQLKPAQLKALFAVGTASLSAAGQLDQTMTHGLDEGPWQALLDRMLADMRSHQQMELRAFYFLRRVRGNSSATMIASIKRQLQIGRPVILLLWGAYNHFTVAVGYTPTRLLLFDSHGLSWVQLGSVGLCHRRSRKRHQIAKSCAVSLWVSKA